MIRTLLLCRFALLSFGLALAFAACQSQASQQETATDSLTPIADPVYNEEDVKREVLQVNEMLEDVLDEGDVAEATSLVHDPVLFMTAGKSDSITAEMWGQILLKRNENIRIVEVKDNAPTTVEVFPGGESAVVNHNRQISMLIKATGDTLVFASVELDFYKQFGGQWKLVQASSSSDIRYYDYWEEIRKMKEKAQP